MPRTQQKPTTPAVQVSNRAKPHTHAPARLEEDGYYTAVDMTIDLLTTPDAEWPEEPWLRVSLTVGEDRSVLRDVVTQLHDAFRHFR
jgi:hypothetical protein